MYFSFDVPTTTTPVKTNPTSKFISMIPRKSIRGGGDPFIPYQHPQEVPLSRPPSPETYMHDMEYCHEHPSLIIDCADNFDHRPPSPTPDMQVMEMFPLSPMEEPLNFGQEPTTTTKKPIPIYPEVTIEDFPPTPPMTCAEDVQKVQEPMPEISLGPSMFEKLCDQCVGPIGDKGIELSPPICSDRTCEHCTANRTHRFCSRGCLCTFYNLNNGTNHVGICTECRTMAHIVTMKHCVTPGCKAVFCTKHHKMKKCPFCRSNELAGELHLVPFRSAEEVYAIVDSFLDLESPLLQTPSDPAPYALTFA